MRQYQTGFGTGGQEVIMGIRKIPFEGNRIYHIYTRSIAQFNVFRNENDYQRMLDTIDYYTAATPPCKFSVFVRQTEREKTAKLTAIKADNKLVRIVAYCLMPTHIHLAIEQLKACGITDYMGKVLKSYSKYFNKKYNRHGPLWEGRFKNAHIETNEQFLHLTRYIHLNPSTSSLVDAPDKWKFSSYREYIGLIPDGERITDVAQYVDMKPKLYKEFVIDRIDYQKELHRIKHLLFL